MNKISEKKNCKFVITGKELHCVLNHYLGGLLSVESQQH